jgi:hypothetical protein
MSDATRDRMADAFETIPTHALTATVGGLNVPQPPDNTPWEKRPEIQPPGPPSPFPAPGPEVQPGPRLPLDMMKA